METLTITRVISPILAQFKLQEKLFNNVLDGLKNEDAEKKINANTNHIAWLTGHLVSTRFMMTGLLGIPQQEPFPELFANGKGLQPDAKYPSLDELKKDWSGVSQKINERLENISEQELNAEAPFPTPTGKTVLLNLAFFAHHEAYTLGQLGIYRRFHGYEAMKYN